MILSEIACDYSLAKGDIVRTAIISKKINTKVFADATLQDLKVLYYDLMIQKETQDKAYLEIAKSYFAIFDTPSVQKAVPEFEHVYSGKWAEALKCVVVFLILSPHDNEQSDFINRVASHKMIDELPAFKSLIKKFVTDEIMKMSEVLSTYQGEMAVVDAAFPADKAELAKERWADVDTRVVEHNIRVVAKCYSKINSDKLAK